MKQELLKKWQDAIGHPENYAFKHSLHMVRHIEHPDFDGKLYLQACGPAEYQKLLKLFPKKITKKCSAVAVPFYHPDGMVGFDLESGKAIARYKQLSMALDLVKRGFITAIADAYPFHFYKGDSEISGGNFSCDYNRYEAFEKWQVTAEKLLAEYPRWSGIGKLIADTRLLVDSLYDDFWVDKTNIGIAGHSLGGKMAFYTGCLDNRIKVILTSDFGIRWDQTNWDDIWYWGEKVEKLQEQGMSHSQLLTLACPKPFMLLAGLYDNENSQIEMNNAKAYFQLPDVDKRLVLSNHGSGHCPPVKELEKGYDFLEYWLKK